MALNISSIRRPNHIISAQSLRKQTPPPNYSRIDALRAYKEYLRSGYVQRLSISSSEADALKVLNEASELLKSAKPDKFEINKLLAMAGGYYSKQNNSLMGIISDTFLRLEGTLINWIFYKR